MEFSNERFTEGFFLLIDGTPPLEPEQKGQAHVALCVTYGLELSSAYRSPILQLRGGEKKQIREEGKVVVRTMKNEHMYWNRGPRARGSVRLHISVWHFSFL